MTNFIPAPGTVCIGLGLVCVADRGLQLLGAPEGEDHHDRRWQLTYSQPETKVVRPVVVSANATPHCCARRYHLWRRPAHACTHSALIDANGLKSPYRLTPGQQLAAPGSGNYDPDLAVTTAAPAANGDTNTGSPPRVTTSTGGSIAMEDLSPSAGGTSTSTRAPAATTAPAAAQTAETSSSPPIEDETQSDLPRPQRQPAAPESAAPASGDEGCRDTARHRQMTASNGRCRARPPFGAKWRPAAIAATISRPRRLKSAADSGTVAYAGTMKGFGNRC
jgi:hypothetical protein